MKFFKVLFRKSKGSKRHSPRSAAEATTSSVESETEENKKERPRSASFSGVNIDDKEKIDRQSPRTNKRRSNSMGHKVKRRSSFIRLFRAARDIGRTLRQIGDDLESRHSHSSLSISSQLR